MSKMDKQAKYVIFDRRESLFESVASDTITFGFLLLCIYVSRHSAFWTFLCGCMFLLFLAAKFTIVSTRRRGNYFRSKAELVEWANAQEDDQAPNEWR